MNNPFFWLGLSILLVAISLTALLTVAILTLQELARAARSAEKLLDNLNRELPATLQDLRLTGKDISGLTDEVSGSMQSARSVVQQVDQGLLEAKAQAQKAQVTTRSLWVGATAALRVLTGPPRRRRRPPTRRPPIKSHSHKSGAHSISQQPGKPASISAGLPAPAPYSSEPLTAHPTVQKPPALTPPNTEQLSDPDHSPRFD
ncbi:MAG: hypothetical protein ACR2FS_08260 [Phormidesmis sp.]